MEVETDGVVWIIVIPWAILRLSLKRSEIAENNIPSANAQTTEKLLLMFRFQHGFVSRKKVVFAGDPKTVTWSPKHGVLTRLWLISTLLGSFEKSAGSNCKE